jgi:hypothetical protein
LPVFDFGRKGCDFTGKTIETREIFANSHEILTQCRSPLQAQAFCAAFRKATVDKNSIFVCKRTADLGEVAEMLCGERFDADGRNRP